MKNIIRRLTILVLFFSLANVGSATDEPPGSVYYRLHVKTGDVKHAGTDARIYVSIYGSRGSYTNYLLNKPHFDDNERNAYVRYTFRAKFDLGGIEKIVVRNSYDDDDGPGWFLDYINLQNTANGQRWHFPCGKWLSASKGTTRIITPNKRCN